MAIVTKSELQSIRITLQDIALTLKAMAVVQLERTNKFPRGDGRRSINPEDRIDGVEEFDCLTQEIEHECCNNLVIKNSFEFTPEELEEEENLND